VVYRGLGRSFCAGRGTLWTQASASVIQDPINHAAKVLQEGEFAFD
jgi:hypothetical protein